MFLFGLSTKNVMCVIFGHGQEGVTEATGQLAGQLLKILSPGRTQ